MRITLRCIFILLLCHATTTHAGAVRNLSGFFTTVYGPNDDGTYPVTGLNSGVPSGTPQTVPIGFPVNFYGNTFSTLYVNNNGNVTFDSALSTFTPFGLVHTAKEVIAPFFADVDTRTGNTVTFGNDTVNGHPAFGVNWINVDYFSEHADRLNSFQLILINRSDRNPGDFDIEYNYDQIDWETGDASSGSDGLGGSSAVVGFSNGSGLPGTSFQLSGSGTPGELLDTNPGGLVHNFLNNNVLGRYLFPIVNLTNTVLNVPQFSQGDARWATNAYGDPSLNRTIQQKGCALSCLAMALKFAGVTTDPGALNTLMNGANDFINGNNVNWETATRDASGDTLEFHAYRTTDTQYLSQQLAEGYPVIVGVNLNSQGQPGHFVLVIGKQNGHFIINDPGHAAATTLDYYNNSFETRGYVGDPVGDISGFNISSDNAADLLILDPLGRRAGFDPATTNIFSEIPQAGHFVDCLEDDDLTGTAGTDSAHMVDFYQPLPGTYQIFLGGTNTGNYHLAFRAFGQNGAPGSPLTMTGVKAPNTITPLQVNLAPPNVTLQTFTNQYPWSANPTNGLMPLTVQFAAPAVDSGGNTVTNWNWKFGDGASSTQQNPSHTYTSSGTYYPSLTAVNNTNGTVFSLGSSVILRTVQFTANPTGGLIPLTVQFTSPAIDSDGNTLTQWNWSFGDGATSTLQNPTHTYTSSGTHYPTLTATNTLGYTVTGSGPYVNATLPTVQFTANPSAGSIPLAVQFTCPGVDSGGNTLTQWNWSFGDGATSTQQNPTHTYTSNGAYYPTLTATNSLGYALTGSGPSISATLPTVQFTANPTSGFFPLAVQFTCPGVDSETNAITQWSWSFGDGATSTQQNPTHTYTSSGTYHPTLIATNNLGYEVSGSGPSIACTFPPAYWGLVTNGGFETGDFTGWSHSGNTSSTSVSTGSTYVHSGTYGADLGPSGSLGYLSQTQLTVAGASYVLSFWLNCNGQTPNEFLVAWNGSTIFDQTNLPSTGGWTNMQFLVTATGTNTVLQFGFQDNPSYLGLDDISVSAAQLEISSISLAGTNVTVNAVNGLSGRTYYLLTSTDVTLPLSQWSSVATNVLNASGNFAIIGTNAVNPAASQQFYSLKLAPAIAP